MSEKFRIEKSEYGVKAVALDALDEKSIEEFRIKNVVDLVLNTANGWCGRNLDFLSNLPELLSFEVLDFHIKSVQPIHALFKLRKIQLSTYCNTPIDFSIFPDLEDCSLEWRPGSDSIFSCTSLKKLFINRYRGKDTNKFTKFVKLENLALLGAPIENLDGLSGLQQLRFLRLGLLKRLSSLSGISNLTHLEELNIDTCRCIGNIDFVERLTSLRRLFFSNCGDIASLSPLMKLPNLELVAFTESTNILDGDMTPLVDRSHIPRVAFQNRKHYSLSREYIKNKTLIAECRS